MKPFIFKSNCPNYMYLPFYGKDVALYINGESHGTIPTAIEFIDDIPDYLEIDCYEVGSEQIIALVPLSDNAELYVESDYFYWEQWHHYGNPIIEIISWGTIVKSFGGLLEDSSHVIFPKDKPILDGVEMNGFLSRAKGISKEIESWDLSKASSLEYFLLEVSLSGYDFSNWTLPEKTYGMFEGSVMTNCKMSDTWRNRAVRHCLGLEFYLK